MIKKSRNYINLLFLIVLLCYAAFTLKFDIYKFYMGIPFGARMMVYAMYAGVHVNLLLYVFGDFENHIVNKGFRVIRYSQRRKIYLHILSKVVVKTMKYDLIIYFTWLILSMHISGVFEWEYTMLLLCFLHCTVSVVMVILQLVLEIILGAKVAILISVSYWIGSVVFLDYISQTPFGKYAMLILLPNLSMIERIEAFGIESTDVFISLLPVCFILLWLGKITFEKKDIV